MHVIVAFVFCICLTSCGFTSFVMKSDAIAFDDIIEDATNKQLVLNLLRARDKAPLHFADIPVIRESMQQSASFSLFELRGPIALANNLRDSRTAGAGMQFTPSFEVTSLNSKDFHTGIATPIDPKFVKYW